MGDKSIPSIRKNIMGDFMDINAETVCNIPISKMVPFKGHTFRVIDDADMKALEESIRENGISEPVIVRRVNDKYEIISGHRRCHVADKLGMETVPCLVRDIGDDDAIILMVDSNCHRSSILPSEKAKSYLAKYTALSHKGVKGEHTLNMMESEGGDKAKTIQRYIRLAKLTEGMLELVDSKRIGFIPAVVLADLNPDEQLTLIDYLHKNEKKSIPVRQAKELAASSKAKELTRKKIENILSAKPRAKNVLHVDISEIREYFPEADERDLHKIIIQALKNYVEENKRLVSN